MGSTGGSWTSPISSRRRARRRPACGWAERTPRHRCGRAPSPSSGPVGRDLLLEVLEQNIGNPTVEVMWGAPGSLLVAAEMLDRTGDPRWADLWSRLADDVWSGWVEDERWGYRIWTQLLYGTVAQYISPAHGFAGNVAALAGRPQLLGPERTAELEREAVRTSTATAVIDGDLANWQPLAGETLDGSPGRVRAIRTQWCHGAPGRWRRSHASPHTMRSTPGYLWQAAS